jgi:hypothetical protein
VKAPLQTVWLLGLSMANACMLAVGAQEMEEPRDGDVVVHQQRVDGEAAGGIAAPWDEYARTAAEWDPAQFNAVVLDSL